MAASDPVRWHRSFGVTSDGVANPFAFDFDDADSDAVPPPLTPASLEKVKSVRQPSEVDRSGMVRWLCYRCSSSRFDWSYDNNWWVCEACGHNGFYFYPSRQKPQMGFGCWCHVGLPPRNCHLVMPSAFSRERNTQELQQAVRQPDPSFLKVSVTLMIQAMTLTR